LGGRQAAFVAAVARGWSVELFVNTGTDNGRLDAMDFSPFGYIIDCSELAVLDNVRQEHEHKQVTRAWRLNHDAGRQWQQ